MKTVKAFIVISLLFLGNSASAYVDCRENINGCTVEQLVSLCYTAPTSPADKTLACSGAIDALQKQIAVIASSTSDACKKVSQTLKVGSTDITTNGSVTRVQNFLRKLGYATYDADGKYGSYDVDAVARFQKDYIPNAVATGTVGPKTLAKLNELLCSTGVEPVQWTLGGATGDGIHKHATVALIDAKKVAGKKVDVEVRNDCRVVATPKTLGSVRDPRAIGSWLACEAWDNFTSFFVVQENGAYVVKERPEDASGLGRDTTRTVGVLQ